jgi:hypothetical protein
VAATKSTSVLHAPAERFSSHRLNFISLLSCTTWGNVALASCNESTFTSFRNVWFTIAMLYRCVPGPFCFVKADAAIQKAIQQLLFVFILSKWVGSTIRWCTKQNMGSHYLQSLKDLELRSFEANFTSMAFWKVMPAIHFAF